MSPTKLFALAACLCVACIVSTGCTPTTGGDGSGNGSGDMNTNGAGDGGAGDGGTTQSKATAESTANAAFSVIIVRNEDNRASNETSRVRGVDPVACPFGGSRLTGTDNITQFTDCVVIPGVALNGGLRYTPNDQGGRIEFVNLVTESGDDNVFMADGSIEETENADGTLSFAVDFRSVSTGDGDTDFFNMTGELTVDDDGLMAGMMDIDSGNGAGSQNTCDLNGVNIFAFEDDPSTIDAACGFDEEDPDFPEQSCDCPEGQDCLPIEGDDGVFFDLCNNCETDEDCLESGLGNECAFGFGCMMFECFSSADCDPGFECVSTVTRGGDCEPI